MATDKSASPAVQLPWAGKMVRPAEADEELTYLWHLAADNMRISQNMNVRTSVLNLVICVSDNKSARQASALLRDLSNTHIARVILVILDERGDLPDEVATWVTLRSFPVVSDIMRHHFEQITVRLSGSALASTPHIVQSLLKPDLPVYLWWAGDYPKNVDLFRQLVANSDRTIVDSSDFFKPAPSIRSLSTLLQEITEGAVSDLNWSRATPWCEMVAQFFDVADYRPYLVNITRIEIEHAVAPTKEAGSTEVGTLAPPVNPLRALFLAAWLKTRLGWQISDNQADNQVDDATGTYSWHMTARTPSQALTGPLTTSQTGGTDMVKEIDIIVRPRPQAELRAGNICLIRLHGFLGGHQVTFSLDRDSDDDHVVTTVDFPGATRPPRTVSMGSTQREIDLLSRELGIMGRDHLYEETLHEVFSLLS